MTKSKDLPLDGIRVVDFTQVMLGPCATQVLADFGADVIKIERPESGELSRNVFGGKDEKDQNNPVFYSLNRNKRSLTLNTKCDADKNLVFELVKKSDVVVNNFRPGVMDRMGFGYEALKALNSKIIFASGSGFGQTGPYVHKGGQDILAQAMTGVMERRADPSIPRTIYPTALCDYTAGMHLVQGILAALLHRHKTGEGQEVSVSLYDSMLAMQMQEASFWTSKQTELNWAALPLTGVFDTNDGAVVLVGAFKANPLQDICAALELGEDLSKLYPDLQAQIKNKTYLQKRFCDAFASNSMAYWLGRLEAQDLLCAPVKSLEEAMEDPQTIHNKMVTTHAHPLHGDVKVISSPIQFSNTPFQVYRPAPLLGQHNDEIRQEVEGGI